MDLFNQEPFKSLLLLVVSSMVAWYFNRPKDNATVASLNATASKANAEAQAITNTQLADALKRIDAIEHDREADRVAHAAMVRGLEADIASLRNDVASKSQRINELTAAAIQQAGIDARLRADIEQARRELNETRTQQVANMRELERQSDRIATLTTGVRVLTGQVVELGGAPQWTLDHTAAMHQPTESNDGHVD